MIIKIFYYPEEYNQNAILLIAYNQLYIIKNELKTESE